MIDDGLKVEEIGIAREAVDPGDPHKERVLERVNKTKEKDELTLEVVEHKR